MSVTGAGAKGKPAANRRTVPVKGAQELAIDHLNTYFNENSLKVRDMLRKLRVENFFSIGPMVELDLSVAKNAPQDDRYARPDPSKDERFAKVAVLYGPNASGKTNVLRAAAFVLDTIINSFQRKPDQYLSFIPCLTKGYEEKDSSIYIEFDAHDDETDLIKEYYYHIKFNDKEITYEEMKYKNIKWNTIFSRDHQEIKWGKINITPTIRRDLKLPPYASVISTLAQYQNQQALNFVKIANSCFTNVSFAGKQKFYHEDTCRLLQKFPEIKSHLVDSLRRFDIDITDIRISNEEYGIDARFVHSSIPSGVARIFESQGTVNLFSIIPYIESILSIGAIGFIDELDGDLHPSVVAEIVRRFTSSENKHNAQLVMTCHNPALLRHLTKDEVHIVEKDADHFTHITALKDMAGMRRDANLEAQYLGGAFGGLPLLA